MAKIDPFDDGLPLPVYMRQVALEMRDRFIADAAEPLRVANRRTAYELAKILGEEKPAFQDEPGGTLSACDWEKVNKAREVRSLSEDECLKHFELEVTERVKTEGRSGKIKAFVIKADGDDKPLPATWWRGSEAATCLGGSPHPEGDLRIRHASRHELNTPDYRKSRAMEWLRTEYPRRRQSRVAYDSGSCLSAFHQTGVKISGRGWEMAWSDYAKEVKKLYPDIDRPGRKKTAQ
jgi:hypothetical protein